MFVRLYIINIKNALLLCMYTIIYYILYRHMGGITIGLGYIEYNLCTSMW